MTRTEKPIRYRTLCILWRRESKAENILHPTLSTRLSPNRKGHFLFFFFFPLILISETLRGSHLARAALSSVLIGCRTFRDAWMTVIPSTLVLVLNLSTSLLHQLAISSPSPLGPSYFSSDLLLRFQPTCCIGQRSSNTPYLNFVHLHAGFEI